MSSIWTSFWRSSLPGVRHTLDAERVSVLLLDDDGRLTPAVAVARQHNDELWQRFRMLVGQVRRLLRDATELLVTVRTDELIAAAGDGPVHCFVVPAPLRAAEPAPKSGNVATSGQTGQAL
ncbi:MAG: hypothetical protein QOI82_1681 [Actinomycetota bacterium]|nr:hypothetical protein [Actinomycetota bacterium]